MENPIETQLKLLLNQAEAAHAGALKYGAEVKLVLNIASRIDTDIKAVRAAARDHSWSVANRPELTKELVKAIDTGEVFCRTVKGALLKHCGTQYSRLWLPVGFTHSLEVPSDAPSVKSLLDSMRDYFTTKPAHAVESLEVTAAEADRLVKAIRAAEVALQDQDDLLGDEKDARDKAVEKLRTRLRGLINELTQLIGNADRRWHSFGFNIPEEPETPGQPQLVSVTAIAPGQLHLECDSVPFADHYRFWNQPHGSTEAPVEVGSSKEPSILLDDLAGGSRCGGETKRGKCHANQFPNEHRSSSCSWVAFTD